MNISAKVFIGVIAVLGLILVLLTIYTILFVLFYSKAWSGEGGGPTDKSEFEWQTPPLWAPDSTRIVFSYRGSIYAAESDGSSLRLIHGDDGKDDFNYSPSISPDGNKVAYLKYRHEGFLRDSYHWEIATSALDGSREQTLTDMRNLIGKHGKKSGEIGSPSWSPDSQRIAFVAKGRLYAMEEDGSALGAVADLLNQPPSPDFRWVYNMDLPLVWSRDGRRVAFVAVIRDERLGERRAIYTIGVDGSDPKKVAEESGMPDLSPDGVRMAFAEYVWDYEDKVAHVERLHTIGIDDAEPREIASLPRGLRWDTVVAWSPDSSEILVGPFVASVDSSSLRLLPRPDTGAARSNGSNGDPSPDEYSLTSWSPDGSRIAIQTTYDSTHLTVLYTVARDGSGSKVLITRDRNGDLSAAGGVPLSEDQSVITIHSDEQGQ